MRLPTWQTRIYPSGMADPTHPFEIATQAGIDLGLIEDNLRLSYEERVLQHQDALNLALAIEQAGKQLRERSATTASAAE